jgi:hypothetical protein
MSNPDFPAPNPGMILFLTAITGSIGFVVLVPDVTVNLFRSIVTIASCICIIGGAVLIVRKLQESANV